jgi:hypothetical protein
MVSSSMQLYSSISRNITVLYSLAILLVNSGI